MRLLVGHQFVAIIISVIELLLMLGEVFVTRKIFLVEHDLVPLWIDAESGTCDTTDDSASARKTLNVSTALLLSRLERQVRRRATTCTRFGIFRLLADWSTIESSSAAQMRRGRIRSLPESFS